jgi:hypothetical protein
MRLVRHVATPAARTVAAGPPAAIQKRVKMSAFPRLPMRRRSGVLAAISGYCSRR